MWADQYSLSRYPKPANFSYNLPFFHSHSPNISRITERKVGGERAARTAQFTYWSCYNTMLTQILNWKQMCRNRKIGTAVRLQPGRKPTGSCPVWVINLPRHTGSGFWPGLEPNQTKPPAKTWTAGGLPRLVANTSCTRPPSLAIVADMSKIYKKLVAACNNEILQIPQPDILP